MVPVEAEGGASWIAEVLQVYSNERCEATKIVVTWQEASGTREKDPYGPSYRPSFIAKGKENKKTKKPWTDTISSNTVLVRFEKLNSYRKLPSTPAKRNRECLQ